MSVTLDEKREPAPETIAVEYLQEFWAVTTTSVYKVSASGGGDGEHKPYPYMEKVALKCESKVAVGERFTNQMIAVARHLQLYVPEGGGITSFQRNLAMVNNRFWGVGTSDIVALFLTKEEALTCLKQPDLQSCDSRWLDQTNQVLVAIGDEHPTISVCHFPRLGLPCACPTA